MVGYDTSSKNLTKTDFIIAGGGSGCITRLICQPLDVLKIRFQLQVEPVSTNSVAKYRSIPQAIGLIVREEGIKSLWKGHVPGQLLSITYGIGQFLTFEVLSREAASYNLNPKMNPVVNFTCGAVAGGVATLVSYPFDVVRTRLVAQSEQRKAYSGILEAFSQILKNEHFFAFYRGLVPTIIQIAPHTGAQFMFYKLFDAIYKSVLEQEDTTLSSSLVSGSSAGLCAKAVIYPLDLVKKRLQIQGFEQNRKEFGSVFKCDGFIDCVIKIYRGEGLPGFFKGLSPSLIKAICATALHFSGYEMICKALDESKKLIR